MSNSSEYSRRRVMDIWSSGSLPISLMTITRGRPSNRSTCEAGIGWPATPKHENSCPITQAAKPITQSREIMRCSFQPERFGFCLESAREKLCVRGLEHGRVRRDLHGLANLTDTQTHIKGCGLINIKMKRR